MLPMCSCGLTNLWCYCTCDCILCVCNVFDAHLSLNDCKSILGLPYTQSYDECYLVWHFIKVHMYICNAYVWLYQDSFCALVTNI